MSNTETIRFIAQIEGTDIGVIEVDLADPFGLELLSKGGCLPACMDDDGQKVIFLLREVAEEAGVEAVHVMVELALGHFDVGFQDTDDVLKVAAARPAITKMGKTMFIHGYKEWHHSWMHVMQNYLRERGEEFTPEVQAVIDGSLRLNLEGMIPLSA